MNTRRVLSCAPTGTLLLACAALTLAACQSQSPQGSETAPAVTAAPAAAPASPSPLSDQEALALMEQARKDKAAGNFDAALNLFSDVIGRNPTVGQPGVIYAERGEVYQSLQRLDEALADYTRALELNQHRDLYLRRVNLANAMGRTELVQQDLAALQKAYPGDAQVRELVRQVASSRPR